MTTPESPEACPFCGDTAAVRRKLVLIDEAWVPGNGEDPRLRYAADLRVDDVKPEHRRDAPLEQFVDGFFCGRCAKGFVSAAQLDETSWRRRGP